MIEVFIFFPFSFLFFGLETNFKESMNSMKLNMYLDKSL